MYFLTGKMGFWSRIRARTHTHTHFKFQEEKCPNCSCVVVLEQLRKDIDCLQDGLVAEESRKEISILHHGRSGLLVPHRNFIMFY